MLGSRLIVVRRRGAEYLKSARLYRFRTHAYCQSTPHVSKSPPKRVETPLDHESLMD
jgi:hypothetical protein